MKADVIILGGGLTGLLSGILLRKQGRTVIIVSAGQSALHFSSGSFELLGHVGGNVVVDPMESMRLLDAAHPYHRIGLDKVAGYAKRVKPLLAEAGVAVSGNESRNHYRLTPIGEFKPAWLTLDDFATVDAPEAMPWKKVAIVNVKGYIDFFPKFIAAGLEKKGVECHIGSFTISELENLRKSTSEMRSTNMARVLAGTMLDEMAREINRLSAGCDAILMPAIVGLFDNEPVRQLRAKVDRPLLFVPTMPTSVPGVRTQIQLRSYFESLGGIYLLGDNVNHGEFENGRLRSITTVNLGDSRLAADDYILATGSFFSHGLTAYPDRICESVFGLDVDAAGNRGDWFEKDIYKPQPYMKYGVKVDDSFHPMLGGSMIDNLYAAGSVLSGYDALREGCGAGVAMTTAMYVAEVIVNK